MSLHLKHTALFFGLLLGWLVALATWQWRIRSSYLALTETQT